MLTNAMTMTSRTKKFLCALAGEKSARVPFWFMRQAGRYLPEYRELRAHKNGFLDLVMDPVAACEVTMQPLRRFGMDAAILFSDILVVPLAMGQRLEFVEGEGPKLEPIRSESDLKRLDYAAFSSRLDPIYQTLKNVRAVLRTERFDDAALIGFAGSPWTVAAYMIEGGGSKDFSSARKMMVESPDAFSRLIDMITEATVDYLLKQVDAGAEALQLFDSWAGLLSETEFEKWVIAPTQKIVKLIHVKHPDVKIIGFPRGAGDGYRDYAENTGIDALGLDPSVAMDRAKTLQNTLPVQGNLDPDILREGSPALEKSIDHILETLSGGPFIFNLGHGIHKDTPIAHVERMVKRVRDFRA